MLFGTANMYGDRGDFGRGFQLPWVPSYVVQGRIFFAHPPF